MPHIPYLEIFSILFSATVPKSQSKMPPSKSMAKEIVAIELANLISEKTKAEMECIALKKRKYEIEMLELKKSKLKGETVILNRT